MQDNISIISFNCLDNNRHVSLLSDETHTRVKHWLLLCMYSNHHGLIWTPKKAKGASNTGTLARPAEKERLKDQSPSQLGTDH